MYYKEQYVFKGEEISKAVIRNYGEADFEALINIQRECFPPPFPDELLWNREQLSSHLAHYPEGALCIEIEGELAGSLTGMLVGDDDDFNSHNWEQVTDSGYIRTHEPEGKNFYIVDIGIRPSYQKMELGKLLLQAAYERVIEDRLERVIPVISSGWADADLIAWLDIWGQPVRLDPNWNGGDYYDGTPPDAGLAASMKIVSLQAASPDWAIFSSSRPG